MSSRRLIEYEDERIGKHVASSVRISELAQAARRPSGPPNYRLFGEVTRALMAAAEADDTDFQTRINALDWNRRLWSTLAGDCARPDNQLPELLRARIISLSLWVSRHSSQVMRREEAFEPLIDVNRMIMQGHSRQPPVEAAWRSPSTLKPSHARVVPAATPASLCGVFSRARVPRDRGPR